MLVRAMEESDRGWLRELVEDEWGLPVVSISGAHDPCELPGLVAWDGSERVGALTYKCDGEALEVVTLNALKPNGGVGSALLASARALADQDGLRLWLITTDSNTRAVEFYQRRGMAVIATHENFIEEVRRHKPALGERGALDPPFTDALELSY